MVCQMNGNYCSENKNVQILTGQIEQITKTNKKHVLFWSKIGLTEQQQSRSSGHL